MFQLKEYQKITLDKLQKYLELTRFRGADGAFREFYPQYGYNQIRGL